MWSNVNSCNNLFVSAHHQHQKTPSGLIGVKQDDPIQSISPASQRKRPHGGSCSTSSSPSAVSKTSQNSAEQLQIISCQNHSSSVSTNGSNCELENSEPVSSNIDQPEPNNDDIEDKNDDFSQLGSPLTRYKHAVCSTSSGFIYIYGGRFGNSPLDDDVWRFDPHHNIWSQLRTYGRRPPCLQEHTLVEYGENLYLFGGKISASNSQECFWKLDLQTNQWHSLNQTSGKRGAHLGPTNRRAHSAVIYGDSMYIFGGFEDFRGSSSQLWEYNLICDMWQLRDLNSISSCRPEPRHGHSAIVYKDSMFIYGGLTNLKPLNDLWRWSWREKRWFKLKSKGSSPGYLHSHSAIQAFDSMFVFGGERNGSPTRNLWRLNLNNMVWQKIRPKGPSPNPTVWHAAIANPLNILDEANYMVEGADSDEEELILKTSEFISSSAGQQQPVVATSGEYSTNQLIETGVKKLYQSEEQMMRPIAANPNNNNNHQRQAIICHSKSINDCRSTSLKQSRFSKLRLSNFLGRRASKRNKRANSNPPLRVSASENNFRPFPVPKTTDHNFDQVERIDKDKQRDQIIRENEMQVTDQDNKTNQNHQPCQGRILDSLDDEIKEMFEQSSLKRENSNMPNGDQQINSSSISIDEDGTTTATSKSQYESAVMQQQQHEWQARFSQRTSGAYTTARSELTMANEGELLNASQATLVNSTIQMPTTDADINPNRQLPTTRGFDRRAARPKSEIVQSLIERADARIKHLCTPLFQPDERQNTHHKQRHSSRNHHRNSSGHTTNTEHHRGGTGNRPGGRNRLSLNDMPKRHTIQTSMTYYNLYFSDLSSTNASPPDQQDEHQQNNGVDATTDGCDMGGDDATMSPCLSPPSTTTTSSTINNGTSTYGNLIGVKTLSSAPTTDQDCSLIADDEDDHDEEDDDDDQIANHEDNYSEQDLESEQESRTLMDHHRHQHQAQMKSSSNHDENHPQQQHQRMMHERTGSEPSFSHDNTSMSFSVIAEFEEDDMLQYSSPTEPNISQMLNGNSSSVPIERQRGKISISSPDNNVDDAQQDSDAMMSPRVSHSHCEEESFGQRRHQSASSGYDSGWLNRSTIARQQQQQHRQLPAEAYSSMSANKHNNNIDNNDNDHHRHDRKQVESDSSSYSPYRHNNNHSTQQQQQEHNGHRSSTTADSLAFASESIGFGSEITPSSPQQTTTTTTSTTTTTNGDMTDAMQVSPIVKLARSATSKSSFLAFRTGNNSSTGSGSKRSKQKKRRYWQLCMFVIGGKQAGSPSSINEPISIWRLYI